MFSLSGNDRIFIWVMEDSSHLSLCFGLGSHHLRWALKGGSAHQCLASCEQKCHPGARKPDLVLVRAKVLKLSPYFYLNGNGIRTFTWCSSAESQYQDGAKCFNLLYHVVVEHIFIVCLTPCQTPQEGVSKSYSVLPDTQILSWVICAVFLSRNIIKVHMTPNNVTKHAGCPVEVGWIKNNQSSH